MSLDLPAVSTLPEAEPCGPVALTRISTGWAVVRPGGADVVGDLVEGMCLADLVTQELGGSIDPDRGARRSARGPHAVGPAEDPRDARLAELERTVAQLEHALAARVSTERAIGVLAERHGTSARAAFEGLRQAARSQGRAVADLAHEVLESLADRPTSQADDDPTPAASSLPPAPRPPLVVDAPARVRTAAERSS